MPRDFSRISVPGGAGHSPFVVPSQGSQAQALPGAFEVHHPEGVGRRSGELVDRFDAAFGFAPQAGLSRLGIRWSCVGTLGKFQCLWGETAPALCATNQVPISYELTAANVADISLTRTHRRGGFGGWGSQEALCRLGLPQRAVEGRVG
jgi:hypothetical protein